MELVVTEHLYGNYDNPEGDLTSWRSPPMLDAYAAALAESGEFDDAVDWQEYALRLLPSQSRAEPIARAQ